MGFLREIGEIMHTRHVQQSQVYSKCSINVYSRALKSTRQMWSFPPSHPVSALWILPPPALLPPAPSSIRQSDLRGLESPVRKPRGGTPLSAALRRVGSFRFLSLPAVHEAPEWVKELPVPKGREWVGQPGYVSGSGGCAHLPRAGLAGI